MKGAKEDEKFVEHICTLRWRMLRDVELYDLYSSSDIKLVIKSSGMAWAGHVTHFVEEDKTV
jgi:hypothetical protein